MEQLQALVLPVGILAVFYFFVIRPQKKKEKEINEMRDSLVVGDEVITIGGIIGKVVLVKEEQVVVETGDAKTRLVLTRWAISSVNRKHD